MEQNHKILTEVTNIKAAQMQTPKAGITLYSFVFVFYFKFSVTCCKWQNYTLQQQQSWKMLKKDWRALPWKNISVWDENIKSLTLKTKGSIWLVGDEAVYFFYVSFQSLSIHDVLSVTKIALRLKRITCNPSYNVQEKLSVAAHIIK